MAITKFHSLVPKFIPIQICCYCRPCRGCSWPWHWLRLSPKYNYKYKDVVPIVRLLKNSTAIPLNVPWSGHRKRLYVKWRICRLRNIIFAQALIHEFARRDNLENQVGWIVGKTLWNGVSQEKTKEIPRHVFSLKPQSRNPVSCLNQRKIVIYIVLKIDVWGKGSWFHCFKVSCCPWWLMNWSNRWPTTSSEHHQVTCGSYLPSPRSMQVQVASPTKHALLLAVMVARWSPVIVANRR